MQVVPNETDVKQSLTSLKKTSAGVRLVGTSVLLFLRALRMAGLTRSGCLAWWFFSTMAAVSFSACSQSRSLVAMGEERTVVELRRSSRPIWGGRGQERTQISQTEIRRKRTRLKES